MSNMVHLNGNILCAVDVETTGRDPEKHDIIQIAVLPLDSQIKPRKDILPFYMEIAPRRPENAELSAGGVNKLQLAKIINEGMDSYRAADLLEEWFLKLKLPENKRISPLAQNWCFDRGFLIQWLGPRMFEFIFDGRYRDTMTAALYCNDKADFMGEAFPYPKVNLEYLSSQLKVENIKAHDALSDCVTTAEVYRRMLTGLI